jgi:hypothetical protein
MCQSFTPKTRFEVSIVDSEIPDNGAAFPARERFGFRASGAMHAEMVFEFVQSDALFRVPLFGQSPQHLSHVVFGNRERVRKRFGSRNTANFISM